MPLALAIEVDTVAEVVGVAIAVALVMALAVLIVRSNSIHIVPVWYSSTSPPHALIGST